MKRYSRILMILLGMSMVQISAPSFAQKSELNASASAAEETIRASFRLSRPELGIETVAASEIPGLYAVQISNGPVLYSTADGKYFVLGDLYQVGNRGFVNLPQPEKAQLQGFYCIFM